MNITRYFSNELPLRQIQFVTRKNCFYFYCKTQSAKNILNKLFAYKYLISKNHSKRKNKMVL